MTKAQIVTQFRVWAKEGDTNSELTDAQIYAWIDAALPLWIVKVAEVCGMAGFRTYTEQSLTATAGVTGDITNAPLVVLEAANNFDGDYRTMIRQEGGYGASDNQVLSGSYARPIYRVLGSHVETSPQASGTVRVRYVAEPSAFSAANATVPTNLVQMAENGLAAYSAGVYLTNEDNGDAAARALSAADNFLAKIPKGFR